MRTETTERNVRSVLLVDDDENILRALVRLLRREGYRLLTASSGHEGLTLLQSNNIDLIISDQRMPEMSGIEFLSTVKDLYPDTMRIVLSGYTELNSVIDAVNQGAIYKFLTKPWDDNLLRGHIRDALKYAGLSKENARLNKELELSNQKLKRINLQLVDDVKDKTRFLDVNSKALQLEQEMLECLPVGVLGIGADDMIALANIKAHELLGHNAGYLVGANTHDAFKEPLQSLLSTVWEKEPDGAEKAIYVGCFSDIDVYVCRLGITSSSSGVLLVLIPKTQLI